jgi:hypothetical protein
MSEKTSETAAPKPTVAELRAEIQQTRADLGETVQALAAKADVKARALDQVEQVRARVRRSAGPVPVALVLAGLVAVAGVILVVRGRRR